MAEVHEALTWHFPDDGCLPLVHQELNRDFGLYKTVLSSAALDIWMTPLCLIGNRNPAQVARIQLVIRELLKEPTSPCPRCGGEQEIVSAGSSPGFTGAAIYWTDLACGHQLCDASGDTLEAVR